MIVGFSLLLAIMEVVRAQMDEMPQSGIGSGHKLRFSALLIFFFSAVFLQRQKRIVNYYVKNFIKESQ